MKIVTMFCLLITCFVSACAEVKAKKDGDNEPRPFHHVGRLGERN